MKPMRFVLAPLMLVTGVGHAATLNVSSSAGDSAAVVANCLMGTNPYGDVRGCGDASGIVQVLAPGMSLVSAADALYPTSFESQANSSATLGTLRAFAQSSIPVADGVGHNLQSHAYADMQDTLIASSSLGALYSSYAYNVNITGTATPSSPYGSAPSFTSDAYVQLNIRVASTGDVLVQKYWETSASSLGNGSISGVINVPAGTVVSLELFMQADTQLGTNAAGQTAFAQADYGNTVHFYLDALTTGANTVGTSGYDYASATAVPEPNGFWMLASGVGVIALLRRRRSPAR